MVTDPSKKAITLLNIDPVKAQKEKDNKAIVDSAIQGFANSARENVNVPKYSSIALGDVNAEGYTDNLRGLKFDIGYSPAQGSIEDYRANTQSGWSKMGRRSMMAVPSIGLGIVELAGHILDTPEVIYGLYSDGKNFDGTPNDFDNAISKWARATDREFKENNKVNRRNPNKTWDMSDPAWYINNGFDTVESILEFLSTGAGVGKAVSAVSKGLSSLGRATMLTDMLGTGTRLASKAVEGGARFTTSLVTAESIAALNASQVYVQLVDQAMRQRKENGELYSRGEAEEIAGRNAATTFSSTLVTSTLLNITSLAPFLKIGKYQPTAGMSKSITSIQKYADGLKKIMADPSKLINGSNALSWWRRQIRPGSVLGEVIQEGTEEVAENLAQDIGRKGTARDTGSDYNIDLFSEENALAFTLGAFGGGVAKGVGSVYSRKSKREQVDEFKIFVENQYKAVTVHMELQNQLIKLQEKNFSDMSIEELNENTKQIHDVENALVQNAIQNGLEDGTIAIMEQELKNKISLDKDEADLAGIDQNKARQILEIVQKVIGYKKNMSSDMISRKAQGYAMGATVRKALASNTAAEMDAIFANELSMYDYKDQATVEVLNRFWALEELSAQGDLNADEKTEFDALKKTVLDLDPEVVKLLRNEKMAQAAMLSIVYKRKAVEAAKEYAKFNNPSLAREAIADKEEQEEVAAKKNKENAERQMTIMQANLVVDSGDNVTTIMEAMEDFKKIVNDEDLSEADRESYSKMYEELKIKADKKVERLKRNNISDSNDSNSPQQAKDLAQKMYEVADAGGQYEIKGEELEYYNDNQEIVNKLFKSLLKKNEVVEEPDTDDVPGEVKEPNDVAQIDEAAEEKMKGEPTETPEEVETISPETLSGMSEKNDLPSDGNIASESTKTTEKSQEDSNIEEEDKPKPIIEESLVHDDNTRGANTFMKEIQAVKMTLAAAEELVEELKARKDFRRYHKIRLGYLIPQIEKIKARQKEDGYVVQDEFVWNPMINNDFSFEVEKLALKEDPKNFSVPVTDIFETTDDGVLLVNTQAINTGTELVVEHDPDWPYSLPEGVKPLIVYRVVNGKKQLKPIAVMPYAESRSNPQAREIRDRFETDDSPMSAIVESKNFGDLLRDRNKDGTPADNPLSAVTSSQDLPLIFGIIKDGKYQITNYDDNQLNLTPNQKKAVETLHNMEVQRGDDTMTKNNNGQHFAVMVAPNGAVVPVYIKGSKLSSDNVSKLMNSEEGSKNLAWIMREGDGWEGKNRLKSLMSISSSSDEQVIQTLKDFKGNLFMTPTGFFWRTNLGTDIHSDLADGSWIRIDYRSPRLNGNPNIFRKFLEQQASGFTIQALNAKDNLYVEFKADYNYRSIPLNEENVELYQKMRAELESHLKNAYNNIDQSSMNRGGTFTDAFGEDTGKSYNDWVKDNDNFTTDVTTNDQKFTNVTTYIKRTDNTAKPHKPSKKKAKQAAKVKVEPNGRVQIGEVDEAVTAKDYNEFIDTGKVRDKVLKKIAVTIRDGKPLSDRQISIMTGHTSKVEDYLTELKKTQPSPDPTPDNKDLSDYMDDLNNEFYRLAPPGTDFETITQAEVDWLVSQIGEENLNMVHGVDRILTIGGQEAFGWFENGLVTLAAKAEIGSGYHEAFHYVFHMALNNPQRAEVLIEMKERFGDDLDIIGLEEKAAELFREYMLNPEQTSFKKQSKLREFFDGLIAWITKKLGMNPNVDAKNIASHTDDLFRNISSGKWKSKYADNFSPSLKPTVKRLRQIPNFAIVQQRDSIEDAVSRMLDISEAMARTLKEEGQIGKTFVDILSNKNSLNTVLEEVHQDYQAYLAVNEKAMITALEKHKTGISSTDDRRLLHQYGVVEQILSTWELTEAESKMDNPPTTFKDEVVKSFSRYGFRIIVKPSFTAVAPAEGVDVETDLEEDNQEGSVKEYIYNVDVSLKSTKSTVSSNLRRKLSLLPAYRMDGNKIMRDENGNPIIEKTIFGTNKRQDFNKVYSNVKGMLADVPMNQMYARVKELSEESPIFAAVLYNLDQSKRNDELGNFSDGFFADFMSSFNNASLKMKTIQDGSMTSNGKPRALNTDRGAAHLRLIEKWDENARSLGLVDSSFLPDTDKWEKLHKDYTAEMDKIGPYNKDDLVKRKKWNLAARKVFNKYAVLIGMDVKKSIIAKAQSRVNGNLHSILLGGNSFQAILKRGADGVNAYEDVKMTGIFAKPQLVYEDDLNSGSFHSGPKQYHSVNMPSFITDMMTDINNNSSTGILEKMMSDPFYNPDPESGDYASQYGNLLLTHLQKGDNAANFEFEQLLEYNDGSGNTIYREMNFEDSFIQKMIAFSIGKKTSEGEMGAFSIGTLSDKLKSITFNLPRMKNLAEAREFYIDAMKRSVFQEAKRMSLAKDNAEYREVFNRPDQFHYVPGANDLKGLTLSISKGEITVEAFNKMYTTGELHTIIEKQLVDDLDVMNRVLVKQGILSKDEKGEYIPSDKIKESFGITDNATLMEKIDTFLLNDKVWKMELSKVMMGDMAKYKHFYDYFKRMYQTVTPGRKTFVGTSVEGGIKNASQKDTHSRLIIASPMEFATQNELETIAEYILKDDKLSKRANTYLSEMIEKEDIGSSLSEAQIFEQMNKIHDQMPGSKGRLVSNAVYIAYAYRENNTADAAAYSSIEFFRDQELGLGRWNDDKEWVYNNVWSKAVTIDQAIAGLSENQAKAYKRAEKNIFASTTKPFYYGQRIINFTDDQGNEFQHVFYEQFKESISPILPIWGRKIGGFSYLLDQFENNQVDVVSTNDAVKQGRIRSQEARLGDSNPTIRRNIPTSNLRYPQVPATVKNEAKAGVQLEKIIMANLIPNVKYRILGRNVSDVELSNLFHDAFSKKINYSRDKLLDNLGIGEGIPFRFLKGEKKKLFLIKMRNMVEEAVAAQGLPDSYIEALNIERVGDNDWDYELGLSFEPYARTYQNILMSHVKKNVMIQKFPGGAMVNMADLSVETDDKLKFVRVEGGKIKPAEIAITYGMTNQLKVGWGIPAIKVDEDGNSVGPTLDEKGNVLYANLLPWQKKGLDVVLYRIPTQMKSSAIPAVVKRILPSSDGAKVILPGRITSQAGLDFDFDKSFFMLRHPGEEHTPPREGESIEDITMKQNDNLLFDIHWSVLTNIGHFEELMTPVSSRTHDALLANNTIPAEARIHEDPFSITSNIEMESLAKYSHTMRGTFSKYAAGHNVLVNLATVAKVSDYIKIKTPVDITMPNGYKFNELGRQKDAYDRYISESHSENLNSALDSQADPKLGKLNVSIFNSAVNGYMNSLGVPDALVKHFMNSPVMIAFSNNYFKRGGVPYNINKALEDTLEELGLKDSYQKRENQTKAEKTRLTEANIMSQSFISREKMDAEVQTAIIQDYMDYDKASRDMSKLNSLLSSDTWKDSDAASLRVTLNKISSLTNPGGDIEVDASLLDSEKSPLKRIAAFHDKGILLGREILDMVTPYFSDYFDETINTLMSIQADPNVNSWDVYNRINELTSLAILSTAEVDGKDIIDVISDGFRNRIALFENQGLPTMAERYKQISDAHPELAEKNSFFNKLRPDHFNFRFSTQLLGYPGSTASDEQNAIIEDFAMLLENRDAEVNQFARDLIAYNVLTSGFAKNNHSFISIVPTSFWKESGVGGMMRDAREKTAAFIDDGYYEDEFSSSSLPTMPNSIIRHMANTALVKSIDFDKKYLDKEEGSISIPYGKHPMPKARSNKTPPMYIKMYNKKKRKSILYKLNVNHQGRTKDGFNYNEISMLGEGNRLHEMFSNKGKDSIAPTIIPKTKKKKEQPQAASVPDANVGDIHSDQSTETQNVPRPPKDEGPTVMEDPNMPAAIDPSVLFGQLADTRVSEEVDDKLNDQLNTFLSNNDISISIVESMKESFGEDYDGITDAVNNAIYLAKGERGKLAKPEEVAHIYIESTLDSRQTQRMIELVEGTDEYKAVQDKYGELYDGDVYKLKREAAAKILSKFLTKPETFSDPGKGKIRRALEAFWNMIKRYFGSMNPYISSSEDIIKGIKIKKGNIESGHMFKVNGDETVGPQSEPDIDIMPDDMPAPDDIDISAMPIVDPNEAKDPEISTEELTKIATSLGRKTLKNVSQVVDKTIASTRLKIDRMSKQKYDKQEIASLKNLIKKMQISGESKALLMYMEDVDKKLTNINRYISNPVLATTLSLGEIDSMRVEVRSFDIVDSILQFLNDNSSIQDIQIKEELKKLTISSHTSRTTIEGTLARLNRDALAPIIQAATSEEVTFDEVVSELEEGTGHVGFIDQWVRSGMDSRDLLVRTVHKLLQDTKQASFVAFYKKMRSKGGFMDVNNEFEEYSKRNGIDISNMAERNEQFMTEVKGKIYLVNKNQGAEKYAEIMALEENNPIRKYYEALERLLVGTQNKVFGEGKGPLRYEIPRVRKDTYERVAQGNALKGVASSIQDMWKDFSSMREDYDYDVRPKERYAVDENNKPIKTIPIYYIIDMKAEEVSLDIASSIAMFAQNAMDYGEMNKIKGIISGMEEVANTRDVAKTTKSGLLTGEFSKIKTKFGLTSKEDKTEARSNLQTKSAINRFFYGEMAQQGFKFNIFGKEFTANKLSNFLTKFSSARIMGFNIHIPLSNALTGEMNLIQEAIGGEFFEMEDWLWAGKEVGMQMAQITADEFRRSNTSKMNGLIEFLNLRNDFKLGYQSIGKQGSLKGSLYAGLAKASRTFSNASENIILAHSIGAASSSIKVQDAEGNDHKFYDALIMEGGEVSVKEGFTYNGQPLEDGLNTIRQRIIFVHQSMHGIYNKIDSPAMNAYILGKHLSFMRGWMFQPLTRRFDATRFSERTGGYREGSYMTMFKILGNTFGGKGFFSLQSKRIEMLTSPLYNKKKSRDLFITEAEKKKMNVDQQDRLIATRQSNVRKAWSEMAMITLMYLATSLMYDDDELDDDDNQFIRYHMLRLRREMYFYNPFELLELHKNPAIAFAGTRDLLEVAGRSIMPWTWGNVDSKDKNILIKKVLKTTPWVNQWYKWDDLKAQANAIEQGFR